MKTGLPILLLLFAFKCFAQNEAIDSIQQALKEFDAKKQEYGKNHPPNESDTTKAKMLNDLSWEFLSISDFERATRYASEGLALSQQLKFSKGMADAYVIIGSVYYGQDNYPEALKNHFAGLKIRQEAGDKKGVAGSYGNIGNVFYSQGNYAETLKNYFAGLKIFEEIGDKNGVGRFYSNIGNIYSDQGNYPEALKNYFAGLKMFEETGDKSGIAGAYNNIGNIYADQGNYTEALKNYFASLKIREETGAVNDIADSYSDIGSVHFSQGNFAEAMKDYLAALKIQEEIGDKNGMALSYINIGNVNVKMHNALPAKVWLDKGLKLSEEIGNIEVIRNAYLSQSEADSVLGDFKGAYVNHKQYILFRDSMVNDENTRKTLQTAMQYEFDKKEAATKAEQDKKDVVAKAELQKQKLIRNGLIGGGAALFLFAGMGVFYFIKKRERNRVKQLEAVRARISRDLHDDMGSTLQSISVMSEIVRMKSKSTVPELVLSIEKIGNTSREMIEKMNDIVWAVNPKNDHFENILFNMRTFAGELLAAKDIMFHFKADDGLSNVKLPMEKRKSFFLVFKEAINNAYKYSGAKNVRVEISKTNHQLKLVVEDDGSGFNLNDDRLKMDGNGLKNMKTRADELNGKFSITSETGLGTKVNLTVNLN